MTSDMAWELAGLARLDGDRAEELRYTNIARGLPPDTLRLMCGMCVGNGIVRYPNCDVEVCTDCCGKGWVEPTASQFNDAWKALRTGEVG